jgi:hypothetical protein
VGQDGQEVNMRCAVAFVAGALTFAMAPPVAAQEFKQPANLFGQKKPAPRVPSIDWNWRPSADAKAPQPTVVCGMTLVPADPTVDPKMKTAAPDRGVTFTLRTIQPATCRR